MRMPRLALSLAAVLFGGCGNLLDLPFQGGSGGPQQQNLRIDSTAALDGMVFSNGSVVTAGGSPRTGDLDTTINGISVREFFSYDLAAIPSQATIDSAEIQVRQVAVLGTPYVSHGSVLLEDVDFGSSLDAGDFGLPAMDGFSGTLSSSPVLEWKVLDVTARVVAARGAGRARLQARLRFGGLNSDSDGVSDAAEFGDAEGSTQAFSTPFLLIYYTTP